MVKLWDIVFYYSLFFNFLHHVARETVMWLYVQIVVCCRETFIRGLAKSTITKNFIIFYYLKVKRFQQPILDSSIFLHLQYRKFTFQKLLYSRNKLIKYPITIIHTHLKTSTSFPYCLNNPTSKPPLPLLNARFLTGCTRHAWSCVDAPHAYTYTPSPA